MILTCPSCTTRYMVDPTKLGSDGRFVRCGKCSHTWHEVAPPNTPRQIDPIPMSIEPRPIPPGSNLPAFRPKPKERGHAWGWAILVLIVAAIVGGAILARSQIVAAWPPAARIYALFEPKATEAHAGLSVVNVASRRSVENGVQVLVVEGEVANNSREALAVPPLTGVLRDAEQRDLQHWTFNATEPKLLPGEVAKFSTTLTNPSSDATDLTIVITPPSGKS
ncbi:MAG TPA: DUF3426 domain-containing protein [Alphaproteobacteria bacterium]